MGWFHRAYIRFFLRLERLAIESISSGSGNTNGELNDDGRCRTSNNNHNNTIGWNFDENSDLQIPLTSDSIQLRMMTEEQQQTHEEDPQEEEEAPQGQPQRDFGVEDGCHGRTSTTTTTTTTTAPPVPTMTTTRTGRMMISSGSKNINVFIKYLYNAIAFVCIIVALGSYYYIHANYTNEDRSIFNIAWTMEYIILICMITFPFSAPLHHSLGYKNTTSSHGNNSSSSTSGGNTTVQRNNRVLLLMNDKTTCQLINFSIVALLLYVPSDYFYFSQIFRITHNNGSNNDGDDGNNDDGLEMLLLRLSYLVAVIINASFFYGGLMMLTLSARAILTRLFVVEVEVDYELSTSMNMTIRQQQNSNHHHHDDARSSFTASVPINSNKNTAAGSSTKSYETFISGDHLKPPTTLEPQSALLSPEATATTTTAASSTTISISQQQRRSRHEFQAQRWLRTYHDVRHDLHSIADSKYGLIYIIAVAMFVVDTSGIILTAYNELSKKDDENNEHENDEDHNEDEDDTNNTKSNLFFFIGVFIPNACMLIMTVHTISYIPTLCQVFIGPKLSMLSTIYPNCVEYTRLATTYMVAPIKFHVGNLEISSEYSNGLSIMFLGIFLFVFGITLPGGGE